jgi:hypothetical protein
MICLVIFINKVFKVLPLTWVIFLNYSMKKWWKIIILFVIFQTVRLEEV